MKWQVQSCVNHSSTQPCSWLDGNQMWCIAIWTPLFEVDLKPAIQLLMKLDRIEMLGSGTKEFTG